MPLMRQFIDEEECYGRNGPRGNPVVQAKGRLALRPRGPGPDSLRFGGDPAPETDQQREVHPCEQRGETQASRREPGTGNAGACAGDKVEADLRTEQEIVWMTIDKQQTGSERADQQERAHPAGDLV